VTSETARSEPAAPEIGGQRLERLREGLVLVLALVAAVAAFQAFRSYVFEDAYITYRYAANLAGGRGFVFNPGEAVLGTSTPAWTLLLALLRRAGADIVGAAFVIDLPDLGGAKRIEAMGVPVQSLVAFSGH